MYSRSGAGMERCAVRIDCFHPLLRWMLGAASARLCKGRGSGLLVPTSRGRTKSPCQITSLHLHTSVLVSNNGSVTFLRSQPRFPWTTDDSSDSEACANNTGASWLSTPCLVICYEFSTLRTILLMLPITLTPQTLLYPTTMVTNPPVVGQPLSPTPLL